MGERTIEAEGNVVFEDVTNNRKAVIIFSTYKKSGFFTTVETGQKDEYQGMIYESTPIQREDHTSSLFAKNTMAVTELSQLKDVVKPICDISGSWLKSLVIDGKAYWDIDNDEPSRQVPVVDDFVCPSDWRYREDLLWLKYSHMKIAQAWKIRMEEQQRHDRKMRLEKKKKGKK
jgi:hypothetical protein